ncbi:MAG: homoserine kinase [Nevskiales bacterium]
MSVYTKVSRPALQEFLRSYPVGDLIGYEGIKAGIENTNYFVNTRDGHWVLTLFERAPEQDLPFFLALMDHLALRGIPSPRPVANADGQFLSHLCGRPAALVQKLDGITIMNPDVGQCRAMGKLLGDLHLAGQSFRMQRANNRGPGWCTETAAVLMPKLNAEDAAMLREELAFQTRLGRETLPQGVIHADLFRDNALFSGASLTGVIDFYFACNDALLYDLAITVSDWCSQSGGTLEPERYAAMTRAYVTERKPNAAERKAWPGLLRAAALRFWLSRSYDLHFPRAGELTHTKNPDEYRNVLVFHRSKPGLELS